MKDFTREELNEIRIMAEELSVIEDVKERTAKGVLLISFADGERIIIPVPQAQKDQIETKKTFLQGQLEEKLAKRK